MSTPDNFFRLLRHPRHSAEIKVFAFPPRRHRGYNSGMSRIVLRCLLFLAGLASGAVAAYGALMWLMSEPFTFGGPKETAGWIVTLTLWVLLPGAFSIGCFVVCVWPSLGRGERRKNGTP